MLSSLFIFKVTSHDYEKIIILSHNLLIHERNIFSMHNNKFIGFENDYIKTAFDNVIRNKIIKDKYLNLTKYIRQNKTKQYYYNILDTQKSKFKFLFQEKNVLPRNNNLVSTFYKAFENQDINFNRDLGFPDELSFFEFDAIVYWVYSSFKTIDQRLEFTQNTLLKDFYRLSDISTLEKNKLHVYYQEREIDIEIINSLEDYHKIISSIQINGYLFYRGHENMNYLLQPSISRNKLWVKNESQIFEDIQVECPDEFSSYKTHLEKLVKMQHYNIPTRLLDITRDPYVALYFSCANNLGELGEVLIFMSCKYGLKYPKSDTVSILSSLSALSNQKKEDLIDLINEDKTDQEFNQSASVLIQQIRSEKPEFLETIKQEDLKKVFIVNALKNNSRISKQNGAFIICGLDTNKDGFTSSINKLRYKNQNDKKLVLLVENKQEILNSLDIISINEASLFPEIDNIAKYIRNKWSKVIW